MSKRKTETSAKKLADLKPADWNPREIDAQNLRGLSDSLKEFGDLSGIVVNSDGTLISGHQRVRALTEEFGESLAIIDGHIALPDGERIRVREVDWDPIKAKAACIAANNQGLQGRFTFGVFGLIEEIEDARPDLADRMNLRFVEVGGSKDGEDAVADDDEPEMAVPRMELQPYEHFDYIVVLARSTSDWFRLCHLLGIEKVEASPLEGTKKIGLGRAVSADRLLKLLDAGGAAEAAGAE